MPISPAKYTQRFTRLVVWVLPVLLLFFGCRNDQRKVVAKVGDYTLTLEQVEKSAEAEEFINQWIDNRLLALEAEEIKLWAIPEVRNRLESITSQVMADELLRVKCDSLEGPSEREIADFYNAHREEFLRTETEVKFAYFEGVEERTLTEIAGKLKGGAKERGLASTYPALNFGWERIIDPGSLPPPYNQFMNYKVGQVLGPLPLGDKYYVFKITAVLKPGTLKMLIEVRDLITERIMGDKRFRMREMLLKSLRTKYHPELNVKLLRNSGLVQGVK